LCAILAGVLIAVLWTGGEPVYNGQSLSHWLEYADHENYDSERVAEASNAVKAIGPRAVPFLLNWLETDPPTWQAWSDKIPWLADLGPSLSAAHANQMAVNGLAILGSDAESALPHLAKMLSHTSTADRACWALASIGTSGIPLLLAEVTNQHQSVRASAVWALASYDAHSAELHRVLWPLRKDSNEWVALASTRWFINHGDATRRLAAVRDALLDGRRRPTASGLLHLGSLTNSWTNLLPEVTALLTTSDPRLRTLTSNTLRRLDPAIAWSLGVDTNVWVSTNQPSGRGRGR